MNADYILETRTCAGGCGKQFKCLPTSSARNARSDCDQVCGGKPWLPEQIRIAQRAGMMPSVSSIEKSKAAQAHVAKIKEAEREKRPPLQVAPAESPKKGEVVPAAASLAGDERMRLWLECVEQAKRQVGVMYEARAEIVRLARRVCDIEWGGGNHWSDHEGVFTAKRFAKEVGIKYKTLMGWLRVWREVVDHLPPGEWEDEDYKYAQQTIKRLGANANAKQRTGEFRRLRDGQKNDKPTFRFAVILQWARSHRNFLKTVKKNTLPKDDLLAMRELCENTVQIINDLLGD